MLLLTNNIIKEKYFIPCLVGPKDHTTAMIRYKIFKKEEYKFYKIFLTIK